MAAVKGPELALRLARDFCMDVKILLTRGGQNFWEKAADYNSEVWKQVQERLESSKNIKEDTENNLGKGGTIEIHGANHM